MKFEDRDLTAVAAGIAALASALCISPLVRPGWVPATLLAVVTVTVTGMALRRLTDLWGWVAVGQLAALACVLMLWAGGFPGPAGVDLLSDLIRQGMEVTREQTPPVQAVAGVVLLTAGGIGFIAVLVDVLAVSLRAPALAGLPLLASYALAIGLAPDGIAWPRFAAPAAAWLVLLAVGSGDTRRSWGRPLRASTPGVTRPADRVAVLGRDGRRVGAITLALALVVPPLLPQLGSGLLLNGGGPGDGDSGNRVSVLNPILDMRNDLNSQDPSVLLRYTTTATNPAPLRLVTDDVFDGATWSPRRTTLRSDRRVQAGLSAPPGLADTTDTRAQTTTVRITGLAQTYLPLPYPTTRIDVAGTWLYDPESLNVFGVRNDTRNLGYSVQSLEVLPSAAGLNQAGDAPITMSGQYLQTPTELPSIVRETAREVTAGAANGYQQAVALQKWFREDGGFVYTTDAPRIGDNDSGQDAMAAFLQQRQGYCVHFASAMAVMARTLGIPARVAVGFLPGRSADGRTYEVTAQDAHAWPELYFEGAGWIRFEPTPATRTSQAPSYSVPTTADDDPSAATDSAAPSAAASASAAASNRAADVDEGASATAGAGDQGFGIPWPVLVAVAALLLAAAAPATAAALHRRRRLSRAESDPSHLAESAWQDLRERLADLGEPMDPAATARQAQVRLVDELPLGGSERAALGRLVADLEAAVFAAPGSSPSGRTASAAAKDVQVVVAGVAHSRTRPQRLRARLLPATGLRVLTGMAGQADVATTGALDEVRRKVHSRH